MLQATRDDELPVSILDVVPTVLSAAGLSVPEELPGVDLLDLEAVRQRDAIFLSVFTGWLNEEGDPVKCLRARVAIEGFWKLMLPGPEAGALGEADPTGPELYDLRNDPLEATDLASREPETVARLRQRMDAWWNPTLPSGS
jgi:uncharacterized sulfatase